MRLLWSVLCWPEDHPAESFALFWVAVIIGLAVLIDLGFLGGVIYVAWHFLGRYW